MLCKRCGKEICDLCDDYERRVCIFCMDQEHRELWQKRLKELSLV